jgi:fructan beta-fructosidase
MKRLITALALTASACMAADDLVIADFEGADYAAWKVTGDAFGSGPARGALPGQMPVTDFHGSGLVTSFFKRDAGMGRLTSPAFRIERARIRFLIGGGGFARETCMNLLVDENVVRTVTGTNTKPGGSEALQEASWDVTEFQGREAVIEIVDQRKGGWGHINVDRIVQTDSVPLPDKPTDLTRSLKLDADYLQLPLMRRAGGNRKAGAEKFSIETPSGKLLRYVHLEFPAPGVKPDMTWHYDVSEYRGQEVRLRFRSRDTAVLERLTLTNEVVKAAADYAGPHRPQFHFSPRIGWMNDINGSHYANGLYHVFYQANPSTTGHSTGFDMHWGHSVSRDLLHWEEWPTALYPGERGQCYSGTAVVTPQGQQVMFYTATGPQVPTTQ